MITTEEGGGGVIQGQMSERCAFTNMYMTTLIRYGQTSYAFLGDCSSHITPQRVTVCIVSNSSTNSSRFLMDWDFVA